MMWWNIKINQGIFTYLSWVVEYFDMLKNIFSMSKKILWMWLEYTLNFLIYSCVLTCVHAHLTHESSTKG
jgi:hypothetical protein